MTLALLSGKKGAVFSPRPAFSFRRTSRQQASHRSTGAGTLIDRSDGKSSDGESSEGESKGGAWKTRLGLENSKFRASLILCLPPVSLSSCLGAPLIGAAVPLKGLLGLALACELPRYWVYWSSASSRQASENPDRSSRDGSPSELAESTLLRSSPRLPLRAADDRI